MTQGEQVASRSNAARHSFSRIQRTRLVQCLILNVFMLPGLPSPYLDFRRPIVSCKTHNCSPNYHLLRCTV